MKNGLFLLTHDLNNKNKNKKKYIYVILIFLNQIYLIQSIKISQKITLKLI